MNFPLWARIGIGVGLAGVLAYATTPLAILTARRFAFYDRPAGYKGHGAPTPYLGGAAVMIAFALALLLGGDAARTLPLLGGVAVLFVVGTIDDRRTVSPLLRAAIEFALGMLLAAVGLGWHLGAGPGVDAVVNGIWVVAVVNAFNLFDNMDGAASTMALVVAGGACILALVAGDRWVVAGSAALVGACLGFLPHNLARPSRIFLGDGGSMPLGFAVAVLVASAARAAEPSTLALLIGFLLVGVPALDTCLVIVSRRRRGISILTGGQDHLTHRTVLRIRTARNVALVLGSAQALVSVLVIVATRAGSAPLVYILLAFVVIAAAVIVGLEELGVPATVTDGQEPVAAPASPAEAPGRLRRRPWSGHGATLAAAALGLGAGLSPLFSAYYDSGVWVPLGLIVTFGAAAAAVARAPRVTWPVALTLGGVAGLGLWSLLSATWSHAVEQATVETNRWLSYAALLLLMIVLLRTRRRAKVLLGATGAGVAIVALTVLARMLGGDPLALFLGGRLQAPLGYINGEGALFAMAAWGGLALAERREPVLAGLGSAATVALACLTLLSQSRGAAIATFVALIVALVAIPGFRRRTLALALVAGGVAAAAGSVLHVYSASNANTLTASTVHTAAIAILVSSAVTGIVWGAAVAFVRAADRDQSRRVLIGRLATALSVAVLAAPVIGLVIKHSSVQHTASTQWHAFVHLSDPGSSAPAAGQTRLFSGAGDRYDYWRVAWNGFTSNPVGGLGAGNYPAYYFQNRRTTESIQNPHSFELQTLSELGIVGMLLLALVVVGVFIGARRLRRVARTSLEARTMMVAATGAVVVWFVDSSGDWMQLLPGVTAVALVAVAVLCRPGDLTAPVSPGPPPTRTVRLPAIAGVAAVAFVLAVGGAGLARAGLVHIYLTDARGELAANPLAAIRDAGRALRLDAANLDAYYVKAAGQARFNKAASARSTLVAAAREDPQSFVTWTLLGDLEVRLHKFASARTYYERAHRLDPLDPQLASLAANPASALSSSSGA